tara:strand:- start:191 stop:478 length:288 start_codon:yes stop_codon:yes gene_type:complete
MKNKIAKNLERVQYELIKLYAEYRSIIRRFQWVTLPGMKSRSPAGEPDNNELFHLLTAFVEELFDQAPRTCAYLAQTSLVAWAVISFIDYIGAAA